MAPPTAWSAPPSRYTPPDTRKNWIIGIVAAVVLIIGAIGAAELATGNLRHAIAAQGLTANQPDQPAHNTIAWYWGTYEVKQGEISAQPPPPPPRLGPQQLKVSPDLTLEQIVSASDSIGATYYEGLDPQGNAWAWGTTTSGALGNDSGANDTQPIEVSMPPGIGFTHIVTSDGAVLALDRTGHIWSWGYDGGGQLGIATQATDVPTPTPLDAPATIRFTTISVGPYDALAIDTSGRAWSWGTGSLGDGNAARTSLVPVPVDTPPGVKVTAVSAGGDHSLALDSTGKAWAWGRDLYGDLGVSASNTATGVAACGPVWHVSNCADTPVPVAMPPGVTFTAIVAAADSYSEALDTTGKAWAWGANVEGELGTDSESMTNEPCELTGPCTSAPLSVTMPSGIRFVALVVTDEDSAALDSRGHVWWWGKDAFGQLGTGSNACLSAVGTVSAGPCSAAALALAMPSGITVKSIALSPYAVMGLPRT